MNSEIHTAVIGGGVVGCAVALVLSGSNKEIFLFEKNGGILKGENQSTRNSGVIHSGLYYDHETRPLKAELCVEGNRRLYEFCGKFHVPALKTGKLLVAAESREEEILELYLSRARENGVPGVRRVSGAEVGRLEPAVRARSGLVVPSAGIVEPATLVHRLYTLASREGVSVMPATEVVGLEPGGDRVTLRIRYHDGAEDQVTARVVINAAGVEAPGLARIYDPASAYVLDPVKGESYKFYRHKRPGLMVRGMNIYPTPRTVVTPHGRHFTVGVHLTPTFKDVSVPPALGSTVTVGPYLTAAGSGREPLHPGTPPEVFTRAVEPFFPGLGDRDLTWHQAGIQARLKNRPDFVIRADPDRPRLVNLLGIDSPGLTSCLAIAERVKGLVNELGP